MRESKIMLTTGQMACLLVAVSTGSAIIFIPGPIVGIAGNSVWISLAGSFIFGMVVLSCILYLHHRHKGAGLVAYTRRLIGKTAAALVLIPVVMMLLFAIPAIIAGVADFFRSGMMPQTPNYIFSSLSFLVVALTARAGVVIAARLFVLLVPIMIVFTAIVLCMAFPHYDWGRLLPIPDRGAGALLQGFFVTAGFPFGEVCLFSLLLSFADGIQPKLLRKRLLQAFVLSGITITAGTLCAVAAFGTSAGHLNYTLYQLASNIEIGGTNIRIEAVVGAALIIGSYMKATMYLIALNELLVTLTNTKDHRAFVYPLALTCTMLSLTLFSSPADFNQQVYVVWPFTVILVGCSLIFLLAGLTWIRTRRTRLRKEAVR